MISSFLVFNLGNKKLLLELMMMQQCRTIDKRMIMGTLPVCYVDKIKNRSNFLTAVMSAKVIP